MNHHNQYCILERDFNALKTQQLFRLGLLIACLIVVMCFKLFSYWYLLAVILISNLFYIKNHSIIVPKKDDSNTPFKSKFKAFLIPLYFLTALNLSYDYVDRFIVKVFYNPEVFNQIYKFFDIQVLVVGSVYAIIYNHFFSVLQKKYSIRKEIKSYNQSVKIYVEVLIYTGLVLFLNFFFIYKYSTLVAFLSINHIHLITVLFLILWSFKLFYFDMLLFFEEKTKIVFYILLAVNVLNFICYFMFKNFEYPGYIFISKLSIAILGLLISGLFLKKKFSINVNLYIVITIIISLGIMASTLYKATTVNNINIFTLIDIMVLISIDTFMFFKITKLIKSV